MGCCTSDMVLRHTAFIINIDEPLSGLVNAIVEVAKTPSRCHTLHTVVPHEWEQEFQYASVRVKVSIHVPDGLYANNLWIHFESESSGVSTALQVHLELQLITELSVLKPPWKVGVSEIKNVLYFTRSLT